MPSITTPNTITATSDRIATPVDSATHKLMLSRRQALIIELGAIEDYLEMERSIVPRRKREPADLRDKFDRAIGQHR